MGRAGFNPVGAPGQDIFRGDVSFQTHFFRGVVKLHLVGVRLGGRGLGGGGGGGWVGGGGGWGGDVGGGGRSLPCPKSGPDCGLAKIRLIKLRCGKK